MYPKVAYPAPHPAQIRKTDLLPVLPCQQRPLVQCPWPMSRLGREEAAVQQLELLRSGHATVQDAASPSAAGVKSAVTSTALKPSSRRKGEPKPLSLMVPPPTFSSAAPAPPLLRSLASQLLDTPNSLVVKEAAVSARLLLAAGRGSSQPMPRAPKSRWRGCAREPGAHHGLSRYFVDRSESGTRVDHARNLR